MPAPIPKPEKRGPKEPKPLQRKTPLRPYKLDKNGIPILSPPRPRKPKVLTLKQVTPKAPPAPAPKRKFWSDPVWVMTRNLWFEQNPPDIDDEYYQCKLCPGAVHKSEATLDHIKPKGSHPELKYTLSNLQAAHGLCNQRKGSMSMELYLQTYPMGELALPIN